MQIPSQHWQTALIYAAPLLVVLADGSLAFAVLLILLALAWRWALTVQGVISREQGPELQLDTISASHFVEKVRWSLDRLGVTYVERPTLGVLGVVFWGRTVPRLRMRTGAVESSIGNSAEILRYLWGRYATELGTSADFLRPTQERLDLEQQIDRYGANLQVWVYYHLLPDRDLTLRAWGVHSPDLPVWQRRLAPLLFPLLRAFIRKAFRISDKHYKKAVQHIESLLNDCEQRLIAHPDSLTGDGDINFADFGFAAISALWLQPDNFAGRRCEHVRLPAAALPSAMRADVARWRQNYPQSVAWIEKLYSER